MGWLALLPALLLALTTFVVLPHGAPSHTANAAAIDTSSVETARWHDIAGRVEQAAGELRTSARSVRMPSMRATAAAPGDDAALQPPACDIRLTVARCAADVPTHPPRRTALPRAPPVAA